MTLTSLGRVCKERQLENLHEHNSRNSWLQVLKCYYCSHITPKGQGTEMQEGTRCYIYLLELIPVTPWRALQDPFTWPKPRLHLIQRYCLSLSQSVHYLIISLTEFSFYFATAFLNLNAPWPDAHLTCLEVIFIRKSQKYNVIITEVLDTHTVFSRDDHTALLYQPWSIFF